MRVCSIILLALAGCTVPNQPPPALPGPAVVYFMPLRDIPSVCAPASQWVQACTRMDAKPRMIVLPLPQDYPGDEYARLVQLELAHAQRSLPDSKETKDWLVFDALKGKL